MVGRRRRNVTWRLAISKAAADLLSDDERIEVVRNGKTLINFFPLAWRSIPDFNAGPEGRVDTE